MIHVSPQSGLVTIAGGKWTTYRAMAEETITAAVESCNLEPTSESKTDGLLLGNQINQRLAVIIFRENFKSSRRGHYAPQS